MAVVLDLPKRREPFVLGHVEARNGLQQGTQIGVTRIAEDVLQAARLHDLAAIHHHDLLGDIRHDAQIVGDHQHSHAQFGLQIPDQLEDLRLHRHVQRGGGLVGDQKCRAADQGHCDHRPLAQATGQLEGVGLERPLRIGKAHQP